MKSDIDIKDDVYMLLKDSELMKQVSGSLSKTKRPNGSTKEDVVISVLANQFAQSQEAYVNVNIYVAEVSRNNQYEENSSRLRTLCDISKEILSSVHGDGYWIKLTEQRTMEVEATNETLINNKLLYKKINE
jgi:predicted ATPase